MTGAFKSSKTWFSGTFLIQKVFFLNVAVILTFFQSEKSQNSLDLMHRFLTKGFTKRVKIYFKESKSKKSDLSDFPSSFCLNLYQSTILYLVKTFRIKLFRTALKISTKACNHERIISSDFRPEVDASLNITCRKVMITYCISKSQLFEIFDLLVLKLQGTETETL